MFPIVTKIVEIGQTLCPGLIKRLREGGAICGQVFGAVGEGRCDPGHGSVLVGLADGELVEMGVLPAEGGLQGLGYVGRRQAGGHIKGARDFWGDIAQQDDGEFDDLHMACPLLFESGLGPRRQIVDSGFFMALSAHGCFNGDPERTSVTR